LSEGDWPKKIKLDFSFKEDRLFEAFITHGKMAKDNLFVLAIFFILGRRKNGCQFEVGRRQSL
jgi:hypothetical protein